MNKTSLFFSLCAEVDYFVSYTDDWASRHRWTRRDYRESCDELRRQIDDKLLDLAPQHRPLAEDWISKAVEEMETLINS